MENLVPYFYTPPEKAPNQQSVLDIIAQTHQESLKVITEAWEQCDTTQMTHLFKPNDLTIWFRPLFEDENYFTSFFERLNTILTLDPQSEEYNAFILNYFPSATWAKESKKIMKICFNRSFRLMDRAFEVIQKQTWYRRNNLLWWAVSKYYSDLEVISDMYELFEFYKKHNNRIIKAKNIHFLKPQKQQIKDYDQFSLTISESAKACYEAQRLFYLIMLFNLERQDPHRVYASEFANFFETKYLNEKIFNWFAEKNKATAATIDSVRAKVLRDDYWIETSDWYANFYFAINTSWNGESYYWSWKPFTLPNGWITEVIKVRPRIIAEKVYWKKWTFTWKETLCICNTNTKEPESVIEKTIRKQDRTHADIQRMLICFPTAHTHINSSNLKSAWNYRILTEQEIISLLNKTFPIERISEPFKEFVHNDNPNSSTHYTDLKWTILVPYRSNYSASVEIKVFIKPEDFAKSSSNFHPAGYLAYLHSRILGWVIPRLFPIEIYWPKLYHDIYQT